MNLEILDKPVTELTSLMGSELAVIEAELDAAAKRLALRKATFAAVMVRRFEPAAQRELLNTGKDTGTVHLQPSNGLDLTVTFSKKVEWDQPKLMAALNAMKPEDAKHYGKVTLAVDERKFTAAPPAVQAALTDARTVEVEKPKFSFKATSAEAA